MFFGALLDLEHLIWLYNKMEICDYPLVKVFGEMLSLGGQKASKITYGFLWNM